MVDACSVVRVAGLRRAVATEAAKRSAALTHRPGVATSVGFRVLNVSTLLTPPPPRHLLTLCFESNMSHEQVVHDRINLYRLVRRLEKSVAEEGWDDPTDLKSSEPFPHAVWIRSQGTLGVSLSLSSFRVSLSIGMSDT